MKINYRKGAIPKRNILKVIFVFSCILIASFVFVPSATQPVNQYNLAQDMPLDKNSIPIAVAIGDPSNVQDHIWEYLNTLDVT